MAHIRHLDRAPIAEAVIEIRVRSTAGIPLDKLASLSAAWKATYPHETKVESFAARFGMQDGKATSDAQHEQLGFLLKTADKQEAVQFRTDAFAFSRLHPYTSWEEVLPKAAALWASYRESVKPERLVRLGVRYINRLRLPQPVDLAGYLTAPPTLPETLPFALRSYLTRLVLHDLEAGNSVTVTQASEPSTDEDHIVVLLDLDAFRDVDMEPGDERVMPILESLRHLKNRAFFGNISERTAEMFK